MASEFSITAAISCYKTSVMSSAVGRARSGVLFTFTGTRKIENTQSVGTSAEALVLGDVTSPHWCWAYNLDSTNFVELRNGLTGADVIRLYAGEFALFPWAIDATPYAIADTASVALEYVIFDR